MKIQNCASGTLSHNSQVFLGCVVKGGMQPVNNKEILETWMLFELRIVAIKLFFQLKLINILVNINFGKYKLSIVIWLAGPLCSPVNLNHRLLLKIV